MTPKNIYIFFAAILFLLTSVEIYSQSDESIRSFELQRQQINKTGMLLLGTWATGNILVGTYGNFTVKNEGKYFHQFNAMWNVVNLGIAAFGYINSFNSDAAAMSGLDILNEFNSFQSFLLLNVGLDAAYIMTGFYLKENSKKSSSGERLRGYGNSLLLQGGFLLLFDIALYFIHQNNANINLYPHLEGMFSGGVGVGINIRI